MNPAELNTDFWNKRYAEGTTGWDLGVVSPPIKEYFSSLDEKSKKILIPGAGNSYEAENLLRQNWKHVYVLDWSEAAITNLKRRIPEYPEEQLIVDDFFKHDSRYDIVVEQTFFCAIDPGLRTEYVTKMSSILNPGGYIVGVLFNIPLFEDHPPFGGSKEEYEGLFSEEFEIEIMEKCYNSHPDRKDAELFIKLVKK